MSPRQSSPGSRDIGKQSPRSSAIDEARCVDVLAGIGAAAYEWDITTDRLDWSPDAARLLGLASPDDISTGRRFARWLDPAGPWGRYDVIFRSLDSDVGEGVPYSAEYRFIPAGSSRPLWIEDCGRWHGGIDGRPQRAQGLIRVINERRARDEKLIYRSDHDELTGGLNRVRLTEELTAALETAERENSSCGLIIVAIDNLGPLNEAYGFDVGDQLVAGVAARLAGAMRRGDALGRLSGNKVGIVLNRCTKTDLRVAGERFARLVSEAPMMTECGAIAVTASIGAVVLPRYARTVGEALARAQEALSRARRAGVAGLVLFDSAPGREAERQRNIAIATEIVAALNAGRVGIALQPIVEAESRRPAFYEGLCRLTAEDGSLIAPGDFMETAERLGIIRLIDHRSLDLAMAALSENSELCLSINVSAPTALDGTWFARLAAHLRDARGLASRLIVEITETLAIADLARTTDFMRSLRNLGCRVAIDDFGAGHTSFRNLRALSADLVKIDGSFVENVVDSADDQLFVATLVKLAKHIGMQTVAERVCSERHAEALRELGVDYLQGHLFGEARSPDGHTPRRSLAR